MKFHKIPEPIFGVRLNIIKLFQVIHEAMNTFNEIHSRLLPKRFNNFLNLLNSHY